MASFNKFFFKIYVFYSILESRMAVSQFSQFCSIFSNLIYEYSQNFNQYYPHFQLNMSQFQLIKLATIAVCFSQYVTYLINY